MADNFTSLRNDRIRIFHLVAPCFLRSRKHRVKDVHPSIEATRLAHWNPMNRGSVATLARGAHSKHSAGVIPFVLDGRFLNKVSRPLPRGPPLSIPDFTRSIILVVKRDEREKIGNWKIFNATRRRFLRKFTANGYVIQGEKNGKVAPPREILFAEYKDERFLSPGCSWITTAIEFLINTLDAISWFEKNNWFIQRVEINIDTRMLKNIFPYQPIPCESIITFWLERTITNVTNVWK